MSKLSEKIAKIDFVRLGLCKNYWLWAHICIAALMTRVLMLFNIDRLSILVSMLGLMIVFEIVEYILEGVKPYGNKKKCFYDAIGDIVAPLFVIVLMLF